MRSRKVPRKKRAKSPVDHDILNAQRAISKNPKLKREQKRRAFDYLEASRDALAMQGIREWKDLNPPPKLPARFESKWRETLFTIRTLKNYVTALQSFLDSKPSEDKGESAERELEMWGARLSDVAKWMLGRTDELGVPLRQGRPLDPEHQLRMISAIRKVKTTKTYRLREVGKVTSLPAPNDVYDERDPMIEIRKMQGAVTDFCMAIHHSLDRGEPRLHVARKYGFKMPTEAPVFEKARCIGMAYAKEKNPVAGK